MSLRSTDTHVSRMLTEGVEDTSIAMYENVRAFGFNSCLDKRERCLNFWRGRRSRFSKYSMSGSLYFVDVELIQIQKTALHCAMFC